MKGSNRCEWFSNQVLLINALPNEERLMCLARKKLNQVTSTLKTGRVLLGCVIQPCLQSLRNPGAERSRLRFPSIDLNSELHNPGSNKAEANPRSLGFDEFLHCSVPGRKSLRLSFGGPEPESSLPRLDIFWRPKSNSQRELQQSTYRWKRGSWWETFHQLANSCWKFVDK